MSTIAIVLVSLFALVSCGEQKANKDIPGSGERALSGLEQAQLRNLAGAMGDVSSYADEIAGVQAISDDFGSRGIPVSNKISRKALRDRLTQSIPKKRCRVKGQLGSGADVDLIMEGPRCPVIVRFQSRLDEDLTSAGLSDKEGSDVKTFEVFRQTVDSPLRFMKMKSDFSQKASRQGAELVEDRDVLVVAEGNYEELGLFEYRLEEKFRRRQAVSNPTGDVEVYTRMDAFEVSSEFRAILFHAAELEGGRMVGQNFYLNGEFISERDYYLLLQDLNNQMGLRYYERPKLKKTKLINGDFDPFN
ncbi:MAG: hypothetical protein AAF203_00305 [Pseudomonadota bacterium]